MRRQVEPTPTPVAVSPAPAHAAASGADQWRRLREATAPQRRALTSGWAGFFVDMVDIYLPVIALAPAIGYFQPASLDTGQVTTLFYVTFAATLVGRPLGAALFGHLADTFGRRRVTLASITGFSVCTLLLGLLPGYDAWGLGAAVALVALRFIDGVFLGGEYTAATPLAFEHCPPGARGLFGGLLMGAYAAAYATVSALVLLLLLVLPPGAYETWGWRIPFVLGGLAGFAFLRYRTRIPESPLWQDAAVRLASAAAPPETGKRRRPLSVVTLGPSRRDFVQVLTLMVGLWLVATSVVSVLPSLLLTRLGQDPVWVTGVLLVAQVTVMAGFGVTGALSQSWGRRTTLTRGAALAGTAGLGLYAVTVTAAVSGPALAVLVVATETTVLAVWGVVTSYCNERFATGIRATGFGFAYSISVVPASFYFVYLEGLEHVMPGHLTQLVLLAIGSCLAVVGASLGPETRDVDLASVEAVT